MVSLRVVGSSVRRRFLAAAVLVLASAGAPLPAETEEKFLVQVKLPSLEAASELQAEGFDVAGVNRKDGTAGVVVTADGLKRLEVLGWSYTITSTNQDTLTIQALQDYTDPQEMSAFMDQVAAAHPDLAQKSTLPSTLFEGHSQYVLKITRDVGLPNDRPSFVLDCQHHAREVMTAEICKDAIDYLTSRYATDPQVQRWLDNINIYVVGSVNPDGAAYVFTADNMWRKNRRPGCPVDVNRNYPFLWGSCNGSTNICTDETNRGTEPGSEPETQGMVQLYSDVRPFLALSYHTYGEYIMYSYGCTDPNERAAMDDVARAINANLQNDNGQTGQYAVGPIWSTIYLVDGGSVDTSYAQLGVYAYTIEANCCSFQPDYATWRDVTVQRQRAAWQLLLDKTLDGAQIRGTITDAATGLPLDAGVAVQEVTFTHGESPRHADSKGHYHWLARNNQTYHVTFSKPGYCSVARTVSVGTGPTVVDPTLVQPTPPTAVSAAAGGDNAIDVSWSPTIQATQYRVLRSLTSGGPYAQVALVDAPATSFHDAGVSGQVPYYYVVRSLQPCESGNSTEAVGSTTGACTVGPAFGGIATVTNPGTTTCALTLGWPPAAARCGGRVTYQVHRGTSWPFTPSPDNLIASGLEGTSYTDHDALAYGTSYTYVVRAVDSTNGADDGNAVAASTSPTGPVDTGTWSDDAGDTGPAKLAPSAPWSVKPAGGKTGPAVYATGTYSNNLCSALTSPVISVQSSSVLSFAAKYDIETGWDAGIVEIAQGPGFDVWTRLTTVNYPDALSNTGNACGFPKTFTGTVFSHSYAAPSYPASSYAGSLSAYAGQDIKLRWRISSDSTGTGAGWWIDDVAVTNAVFRQACFPGSAPSPGEVGVASPLTASRSGAGTGIDLSYGTACGTLDNVVYWGYGPISGAPSWTQAACAIGNTGHGTFDPGDPAPGELLYFVVVGQSATREGSYGTSFDGQTATERPPASGVAACGKPQDLSGACP